MVSYGPGNSGCKLSGISYSKVNSKRYSSEMVDTASSSCSIGAIDASRLEAPFGESEVWEAVTGCRIDKAPDGFNFKLMKRFWSVIKEDVMRSLQWFWDGEEISKRGIPLPTIVVVGDQSSGKSSVLESLAGISLPRERGICTRVPLVMRLQHHEEDVPKFTLKYQGKEEEEIDGECGISKAIDKATVEVAGNCKGVANIPLTLVVKKKGVPDLTLVDLPGITRNRTGMIKEYIEPDESIILNVFPASIDFTTCDSIRMSRRVDSTGERTLAVVTKCDVSPEQNGLYEKVMSNDLNIGLGYTCVINRINDETYDEARVHEAKIFETHPLLSKIDNSMVGIPALANKLVQIQSEIISKCLPDIVKKINEGLYAAISDLNKLPRTLTTVPEAMFAFSQIVWSLKETLQRMLIRGEFDQYEDDKQMHCNARLVEMLDDFSKELKTSIRFSEEFLVEEMKLLEKANGIRLPNVVPHSVFLSLLQKKVDTISKLPDSFVDKVWGYIEIVSVRVLIDRCENYPQLLSSMRKATLHVMWEKKLMGHRSTFSSSMSNRYTTTTLEGYGDINIRHLYGVAANTRDQAFDLKMRMTAYWKIVLKRLVDWVALQLRFLIQKVVNKEIEMELNEVIVRGGGIEKMLDEPPSVAIKREKLQRSIGLLKESKEVIEQVMDGHN
ncbi:dynamin-related protein 4C [Tanacetum coccineum]